ncbi:hypothetical protein CAPN001_11590 [Capnocytophaga stomatis]|uniref:hypothetical protein n=1 Tax=Capnocytophaga stomatis TaxID=1848904 RepID=UPI00195130E3|nr:hypothetical protein [Capnocytophaga stomatis]GIJ96590.1 hypothetical protein CAPN001_11590 [Capnocytophaga stomatis]
MKRKTLDEKIIHYFRTNRENTVPTIARKFQVSEAKAHKIIDKYLYERRNEKRKEDNL